VDWAETNAALGQVLLLLLTMALKSNYKFTKYILLPAGSFSRMAKVEDSRSTYELYGSNDINLGRLFWYRRFDTALVWLLTCVQELSEWAASQDPSFKQQYPIKGDLISGVSIKLQFNADHKWTKALKYTPLPSLLPPPLPACLPTSCHDQQNTCNPCNLLTAACCPSQIHADESQVPLGMVQQAIRLSNGRKLLIIV
jgi:hypothetical protein